MALFLKQVPWARAFARADASRRDRGDENDDEDDEQKLEAKTSHTTGLTEQS